MAFQTVSTPKRSAGGGASSGAHGYKTFPVVPLHFTTGYDLLSLWEVLKPILNDPAFRPRS